MSHPRPYEIPNTVLDERSAPNNPLRLFDQWYQEAVNSGLFTNPGAMTLCTATKEGVPSARMVLLKQFDQTGLRFFTNTGSPKAQELNSNPVAALVFYWQQFERQIRITGRVQKLTKLQAIDYFLTRPIKSQISAWASPQSQPVKSRETLEGLYQHWMNKLSAVNVIPKPTQWGGFVVIPEQIEFWQGRDHRLHDRILYTKQLTGWQKERLAP